MVFLCAAFLSQAQTSPGDDKGAVAAIKTNLPYWGVGGTFNLGAEFRLARHWTLDLEAGLNPFDGKNDDGSYDRTMKHFRAHPELRYWFCESFQLRIQMAPARALELGGHARRRIPLPQLRQVPLQELRQQVGRQQEALLRPYAGGRQLDLLILKHAN